MTRKTRRFVLRSRPNGLPTPENFELVDYEIPPRSDGTFLVENSYLGLSPASRIQMSDLGRGKFYSEPTPIGAVVYGQSLGTIVESRNDAYSVGEMVMLTAGGWQKWSVSDGSMVNHVDPAIGAPSLWLGALGVSGFTAYTGLMDIGKLQPSDTVAISAASGAVGAVAGQLAKSKGCRVIGIAGGAEKCAYTRDHLGFDEAVDYRDPHFTDALAAACKGGVDLYFDNVGGAVRAAMLGQMNTFGRVVVCGMIAEYNNLPESTGPSWMPILGKRLTVRGFLLGDHMQRTQLYGDFLRDVGGLIKNSGIKPREDIVDGFENTPHAFIRMLSGKNFGKTIVRI